MWITQRFVFTPQGFALCESLSVENWRTTAVVLRGSVKVISDCDKWIVKCHNSINTCLLKRKKKPQLYIHVLFSSYLQDLSSQWAAAAEYSSQHHWVQLYKLEERKKTCFRIEIKSGTVRTGLHNEIISDRQTTTTMEGSLEEKLIYNGGFSPTISKSTIKYLL